MVLTVVDSDSNSGFSLSFKVDSKDVRDVETFKLKM